MGITIQRVQDRQLILGGLGAVQVRHGSAGGYTKKVLGYSPVAYWPLNETSGLTAYSQIDSAQNGTYTNVTLADATSPPGTPCPYFGATAFCDILTDALKLVVSKAAGTMMVWMYREVPPGWNVVDTDHIFWFYYINEANAIGMYKAGPTFYRRYQQGATNIYIPQTPGPSGWVCVAMTWDTTADEFKAYNDGIQYGATQSGLVAPVGYMSYARIGPGWDGWLAHAAVWDTVLTEPELLDLATV